ncbi:MAG: hypothetical protein JWM91_4888 [Rhodospirillales bacterium]|nr:hypothetical protein [Rhodospirillales bacterium]
MTIASPGRHLLFAQDMTATLTLTFHNSGQACDSASVMIRRRNGTGSGATAANRIVTSGANTLHYTI